MGTALVTHSAQDPRIPGTVVVDARQQTPAHADALAEAKSPSAAASVVCHHHGIDSMALPGLVWVVAMPASVRHRAAGQDVPVGKTACGCQDFGSVETVRCNYSPCAARCSESETPLFAVVAVAALPTT